MPLLYTGNPANAQAPDPGPAPGRRPIILLPDNGDTNNTGTWGQPFKCLADWMAYFTAQIAPTTPLVPLCYGDGSDGPLTVTGATVNISGATKNYTNLTIGAGGVLIAKRCLIRVNGTLTIDAAGLIHDNGSDGVTGVSDPPFYNSASLSVGGQGTDGIGGSITALCPVGGGTSGGAGGASGSYGFNLGNPARPGAAGADFAITSNATGIARSTERAFVGYSAKGGAGGAGNGGYGGMFAGGAAGAAGCGSAASADLISSDMLAMTPINILAAGFVRRTRYIDHGSGDKGSISELVPLRGGGGGGGGGGQSDDTNDGGHIAGNGGSGGSGGGVVMIFASKIVLGSSSCIQARGGNGSNGDFASAYYYTGQLDYGGGGGGGGGGGRVLLFHNGLTGTALVAANCVGGGTAGVPQGNAGFATAGAAGGQGSLNVLAMGF